MIEEQVKLIQEEETPNWKKYQIELIDRLNDALGDVVENWEGYGFDDGYEGPDFAEVAYGIQDTMNKIKHS
jgi:hypothetical protein